MNRRLYKPTVFPLPGLYNIKIPLRCDSALQWVAHFIRKDV